MDENQRVYPRKPLRCIAKVMAQGGQPLTGRTVDLSMGGVCLLLPEELRKGMPCAISFEVPIHGEMRRFSGLGRVAYCVLSGTDGFRTGLQFMQLDAANTKILNQLMAL